MGKKIKIIQPEEVRKGMEERICAEISTIEGTMPTARRLALALYHGATCIPQHRKEAKTTVLRCLEECYGMKISRIRTAGELLEIHGAIIVKQALVLLFGEKETIDLIQILSMRLCGPVSEAVFRTPFHSYNAGDYVESIMVPLIFRWVRGSGCPVEVLDYLMNGDIVLPEDYDISNRLALELWRKNPVVIEAVQQVLNQETSEDRKQNSRKYPVITREILQGVMRSGHAGSIRILKRLLMDKSQPSKLREMILTVVDEGSSDTFTEFLELIYEEKLYRSPAASRIIDTWLWLGFGALEPQMAERILKDSLMYLNDPELCLQTVEHGDMQNVHLALWALAVRNIRQIWPMLWDMLHSQRNVPQINAMNFICNVQHEYLDYKITVNLLEQAAATASPDDPYGEAMELLAWLVPNLIPQDLEEKIPEEPRERQHLFGLLERTLELVGNEERYFYGKPFAWSVCKLNPELLAEAMLRLTYVTKDRSMVRALARKLDYFTPKQRGFFYEYLLDPLHWKEDDYFLQDHLNDRSSTNRQLIRTKLDMVRKEMEAKGEALHRY